MGQPLRVRLLGGLEVEGVEGARLGSRKGRRLVKVLALARGAPVSVGALAEALWPDGPPERPAEQISVLASRLRRVIGRQRLTRGEGGYALAVDWLDVDALADLVAEAQRRWRDGRVAPARAAAAAALVLARGPVLPDEPEAAWAVADRAAVERALGSARVLAGEGALASGDGWEAVDLARQALDADPYDEAALRLLMSAHAATGRPALALAAYAQIAELLAEELGTDPAAETAALHVAILRGTSRPAEPPAAGPPDLPGRSGQLTALDDALRTASAGRLSFVVVEGEAGIGKTALLDAWAPRARAAGATVLRTAGDEFGGSLPLEPVLAVLTTHLRSLEQDTARELLGPERDLLGPLLGEAAPAGSGPDLLHSALTESGTRRALLFAGLEAVMARLAATAPLVLIVDDGHLADQSTAEWLHHCARRLPAQRLLLVVARRPEEGPGYVGTLPLPLDPLDLDAIALVVGEERAEELYARTKGHPLFLLELSRFPGVTLPESVQESVGRRCERAGPAARTVRAAAVLGTHVDLDLLAQVLGQPSTDLLDHLEEGVRRHLLTEQPDGFAFSHQLVREALAAGTSAPRRALLHREAAATLTRRTRPDPLRVAYHAREGGNLPAAATALADAADIAAARFDHDEALRLSDEAATLDDTGVLRLRRARVQLATGRYGDAASDAGAALAAGEGARALQTAAQAAYYLREFPRALRLAEDGVDLADDPEVRASCAVLAGRTELAVGELGRAERWLTGESARTCQPVRAMADLHLAMLRNQQGDGEAALSVVSEEGAPRQTLEPFARAHRHLQAGHALGLLGRPVEALAAFERLEQASDQQHTQRFAGRAPNFRAWILRNLGAYAEADDCNERAFAEAGRHGIAEPRSHALLDLAEGRLRTGDLDAAAVLLRRAAEESTGVHALRWRHEIRLRLLSGRLALAQGAAEEAIAAALEVLEDAQRLSVRRYAVLANLLLARARAAAGDPPAPELIAEAVEALDAVAPLESWYLTAELARDLEVDAWGRLAGRRANDLATRAGPWAEHLRRAATPILDGLPG